jgi:uncharacterized protein YndB with AHSA1/START domain
MTKAIHGSFTIERVYDASPQRVFKAFSDPVAKARWFNGPPGWKETRREFDFRAGGQEVVGGKGGGHESLFVARYHEIVPNERIVYVYDMHVHGTFMSVSLATIELSVEGAKTRLCFTEQAVYVNGKDGNESRREGTAWLLELVGQNLPD